MYRCKISKRDDDLTLDELLASTDSEALTEANTDSEWLETSPRVGREVS
jgi:antitoxin ChpS